MTEETSVSKRTQRTFTVEQKAKAVHLARETGDLSQVARDLDITRSGLGRWIERAKIDAGQGPEGALTSVERKQMRRSSRSFARSFSTAEQPAKACL